MRSVVRSFRAPFALVALIAATVVGFGAPGAAAASPATAPSNEKVDALHYVALGDSRAASATVTTQVIGCGRAPVAYPDQLAALLKPVDFRSVACAGAKAANITSEPQLRSQGFVPPQADALRPDTDLVTVSIGGNDTDWGNISRVCFVPLPNVDAHCRSNAWYRAAIANALRPLESRMDAVLTKIDQRSPDATVVVVGQGGYFGEKGCFPANPASAADLAFIRKDFFGPYNDIMRTVAERHDAIFIDAENLSVGHDACAGRDKWYEGYFTSSEYLGFHPNLAGNKAIARMIVDALPADITDGRGR